MDKSVVIVTHELLYGASQALRDYLIGRYDNSILFISHPIRRENHRSYFEAYHNKAREQNVQISRDDGGTVWGYFRDIVITWRWLKNRHVDIYIGVNPLNCIVGLFLKRLGQASKVIFYSIDFTPTRFANPMMNWFYHELEKWCVHGSDERWNVSDGITRARKQFLDLSPTKYPQKEVPIGIWKKDILASVPKQYVNTRLVFVGDLLEKQGVQKVLESMSLIGKKVPRIHLLVIGGGPYELQLKKLVVELNLQKYVTFTGWISNQQKIRGLLSHSAVGLAVYDTAGKDGSNFSYYSDSTKIKTYLSCGLPVITSPVAARGPILEFHGCGTVVSYTKESISAAVVEWLTNKKKLINGKESALALAKRYTWEHAFESALKGLL